MLSILQKLEMNLLALENQGLECLEIQVKLLLFFFSTCVRAVTSFLYNVDNVSASL